MPHPLPQELERDIARAYEAGDLATAIESLTAAFRKRRGETIDGLHLSKEQGVSDDQLSDVDAAKVVENWRDLLGPGGPEGETAEDFLGPIYERRDASQPRNPF